MVGWIVFVVVVIVLLLLSWWNGQGKDDGPGDELARKFRSSGGWLGM
jgi:hypothetical protein